MFRSLVVATFILLTMMTANAQNSYYFSRSVTLPDQYLTAKTIDLQYPINMENVKAIGMGSSQLALGNTFNAMMYNPAFLGIKRTMFDILTINASLPPSTYDAAFFLEDNIDEFTDASSLNEMWDAVNLFFAPDATLEQRVASLSQLKDSMDFTIDLISQVTGSSENPEHHGISVVPAFCAQ